MARNISNFPKMYINMMHDLMSHVTSKNAQTTIEGLKNLYFHRQNIAAIDDEHARNNEIFKVTHLEVDPGFCTGKTKEERLGEINEKISLLLDAYDDAKRNENLEHFFLSGFDSDSRLNHRIEWLSKFYQEHKGKKPVKTRK